MVNFHFIVVNLRQVSHRSAFVHHNTGITELEYFGNGRFLLSKYNAKQSFHASFASCVQWRILMSISCMNLQSKVSSNQVPHLSSPGDSNYITGGSLKDGWSYLMPSENLLDAEVSITYADEIQPHIKEQTDALRSLYLSKRTAGMTIVDRIKTNAQRDSSNEVTILVKRGLQVVGCACLDEKSGLLHDVVVRPSARRSQVGESLIEAVMKHAKISNEIDTLIVQPHAEGKELFEKMGFVAVADGDEEGGLFKLYLS